MQLLTYQCQQQRIVLAMLEKGCGFGTTVKKKGQNFFTKQSSLQDAAVILKKRDHFVIAGF